MSEPPATKPNLHIDRYEKNWMRFTIVLLIVFAAAVTVAGFALGFQVPSPEERVDPNNLTGPWENPGLRELSPGVYELYIIGNAESWQFNPREVEVPVGATVTFYVTSTDIQHGFKLQDTNINMQIVPGHVSKLTYTFDTAGEYPYICTEYCGVGHAAMFGTLTVVEQ
jgi:cytochrome c oxidase subunit 2